MANFNSSISHPRKSWQRLLMLAAALLLQSCYHYAYDHDPYQDDVYYGRAEQDYHAYPPAGYPGSSYSVSVSYGHYNYWSDVGFYGPFGYVGYLNHHHYSPGYFRYNRHYARNYPYYAGYYRTPRYARHHRRHHRNDGPHYDDHRRDRRPGRGHRPAPPPESFSAIREDDAVARGSREHAGRKGERTQPRRRARNTAAPRFDATRNDRVNQRSGVQRTQRRDVNQRDFRQGSARNAPRVANRRSAPRTQQRRVESRHNNVDRRQQRRSVSTPRSTARSASSSRSAPSFNQRRATARPAARSTSRPAPRPATRSAPRAAKAPPPQRRAAPPAQKAAQKREQRKPRPSKRHEKKSKRE